MKLNKINAAILASAMAAAVTPMTSFATDIEGAVNDHIPLGTAYNSLTGEFLNFQTVKGQVKVEGNTATSVKTYQNMSYEEVSSRLSGDVTINADFPVVQAEASADLALETASDAYSSNWVMSVINEARSEVLRPIGTASSVTLSAQGQTIADQNLADSALLQAAGDEFVTEIEYSTQLFVSMKAEYLSTADKDAINGAISVDFAVGNVSGDLSYLSEEQKQSVKVTVRAHQFGGDPLALLNILPDNIITCDLTNFTPCETLFEQAIQYAKGMGAYQGIGFKDQVADISNSNVVGYKTEKYDQHFGTYALAPSTAYTKDNNTTIINALEDDYVQQLEYHARATGLLSNSLSYLNETQRAALRHTAVESIKNAEALRDLVNYCSTNVYNNDCTTYLAANCPATATSRSCLSEFSTDVFNQANNNELDVAKAEFSLLAKSHIVDIHKDLLLGKRDGQFKPKRNGSLGYDNNTGKVTGHEGVVLTSPSFIDTEFMFKTNVKLTRAAVFPQGSGGFASGNGVTSVYKNGEWVTVQDNSLTMDQNALVGATNVGGYYYYRVDITNIEYPVFDFSRYGSGQNIDFYFYTKPTTTIGMTTGLNAEGTPFYFTARNIDIDTDVDGNTIGWCPNTSGVGVQRASTVHCLDGGRMYTWAEAAKACEAYSAAHEGSTGLVWSLPTAADIDLFTARVEQESGVGKAGYYLKGYDFALVDGAHNTVDALGFSAQETGYILSGWTESNATLLGNISWGYTWMADDATDTASGLSYGQSFGFYSHGDPLYRYNFEKDTLLAARCIGKYVK